MRILKGYRRCGKTTYAIREGFRTNAILVTGNVCMKRNIEHISLEMHMPIEVITVRELVSQSSGRYNGRTKRKIIIDQLEWILYEIFKSYEITDVLTDADVFYNDEWNRKSMLEWLKEKFRRWWFKNIHK